MARVAASQHLCMVDGLAVPCRGQVARLASRGGGDVVLRPAARREIVVTGGTGPIGLTMIENGAAPGDGRVTLGASVARRDVVGGLCTFPFGTNPQVAVTASAVDREVLEATARVASLAGRLGVGAGQEESRGTVIESWSHQDRQIAVGRPAGPDLGQAREDQRRDKAIESQPERDSEPPAAGSRHALMPALLHLGPTLVLGAPCREPSRSADGSVVQRAGHDGQTSPICSSNGLPFRVTAK